METENLHKPPPSSPPSLTSSPSHDFSFTISLLHLKQPAAAAAASSSPDFVDLSPADDIFFHGHLLPLHFLSHRPSNASIQTTNNTLPIPNTLIQLASSADKHPNEQPKATPFSSFFPLRNWLRGTEDREAKKKQRNNNNNNKKKKKKKKVLFSRLWKKYASLVEPLLFFKAMKEKREFRSFSGDCNPREGGWRRRWRGDFSAPASMRTSPANSGLLVPPSTTTAAFSSSDESTMEELQNAIQAAIAHCKSSVAVKDDGCGC